MRFNTEGDHNVAMGRNTLYANTDGGENVAIGMFANEDNTTSHYNIAIGFRAMRNKTGEENIYIGADTGADTNAAGANDNVVVGHNSGQYISGERNTIIGGHAGQGMSSAYRNTIIGNRAGQNVDSSCITSTFLGYYTGIVSGSGATNVVCIGNSATTSKSNIIVLGSGNIVTYCPYRIGVGTNVPSRAAVDIRNYASYNPPSNTRYYNLAGATGLYSTTRSLSLYCSYRILVQQVGIWSDRRIKKNIEVVSDSDALDKIRNIECYYYDYIDSKRSPHRKIGFISQEVEKVFPLAVMNTTDTIPDEYRLLTDITWLDGDVDVSGNVINYKMKTDLTGVAGMTYRFILTDDEDGEEIVDEEIDKDIKANDDDTFTLEKKYKQVFCYGKEVDDFRTIETDTIFALHHPAIQELDRQQLSDKKRITELETQLADVLQRLTNAGL